MTSKFLVLLSLVVLTACGGGGGGGSSPTPSTVGVSGVASKGLLGNATVKVYSVSGGTTSLLGTTVTDADGAYSLAGLTATTNPIIVEIETTATTTMCDETAALSGGKFVCPLIGPSAAGTVIRSTLPDLSSSNVAHVTPFSEMAVAAAESIPGGFTAETLAAGQATVEASLGFNPISVKPVNADAAMTTDQEAMMAMLSAVMLDAKLNATTCTGDTTGTKCMITRLKTASALTASGSSYTALSIAAGVNGPKDNFTEWAAGRPMTNAAGLPVLANTITKPANPFMTAAATKANSIPTFTNPAAVDPAKAKVAQGLQNFINSMREGVNTAKDKIDERLKAGQLRTDALIGKGTSQSFDLINLVAKNCDITANVLNCNDVTYQLPPMSDKNINYVRIDNTKYCFYHTLYDYADKENYTVSGNFEATQNETTGVASGKLNATTTTYFNPATSSNLSATPCDSTNPNPKLSELSMDLSGSGLKNGSTSGNVTINTLTFKAYDQTVSSTKWAQMALSGISLSATKPISGNNLATATLTAPLAITSSDGDNVTGRLSATIQDFCKDSPLDSASPCTKSSHATKIDVSFRGVLKEGAIASFNMVVTQAVVGYGQDGYKPWLQNSASNPINGTATMTMTFADSVTIALTETLQTWQTSALGINFTSNGNTLYLTAKGKNKSDYTNAQVLDGDIDVKSSGGIYRATLREGSDNKGAGEVFQGNTQIGNIAGGVLYLRQTDGTNGRIISLK